MEFDTLIVKNLHIEQIQPSKFPMAILVFFIKKKDSSLKLV